MKYLFFLSLGALIYTYCGYLAILLGLRKILGRAEDQPPWGETRATVSIIVAAYNEEANIAARLTNLRETLAPGEEAEIIVASDGSTDRTVAIARSFPGVKVLDYWPNQGKALVHNRAVKEASGELLLFTDAESEFVPGVVTAIRRRLADPRVGCVVGNLVYKDLGTGIAASEGIYMRWERLVRELESHLGLLATGSGACLAVRKKLWRDLEPSADSDFITPLDVILQGYRVVFAPEAIAYDVPPATSRGEFRARVRQTSKNFLGTLKRWGLRGWLRHPLVSWALVSHKFLRWFTLYFLLLALISNGFLWNQGLGYRLLLLGQGLFYLLALVGFAADQQGRRLPGLTFLSSFGVASLGMGLGVLKGLTGRAPAAFRH